MDQLLCGSCPSVEHSFRGQSITAEERPSVLFLIRSLVHRGGAERQLVELVKGLHSRYRITVVSFYDGGELRSVLEQLPGVEVQSLHKTGRWDLWAFLLPWWHVVRRAKPQILHGYQGAANELCLVAGKITKARVIWGVRDSDTGALRFRGGLAGWVLSAIGRWLSRFPDLIIVNSQAGRREYVKSGFCPERMAVVSNGIDTERFQPDGKARAETRSAWGIQGGDVVVGKVGRLNVMKDHPTFLRAAAILARRRPRTRFVCIGEGPESYRAELERLTGTLELNDRLQWLGSCANMPGAYNGLDLLVSSSAYGEGFSNVVGEAMSCGIPCVVTDVGDSQFIVGGTGFAVPPGQPDALASACEALLAESAQQRRERSFATRRRIVEQFSAERMVAQTDRHFRRLLGLVSSEEEGSRTHPTDDAPGV